MQINIEIKGISKKTTLIFIGFIFVAALIALVYSQQKNKSPVPKSISSQLTYKPLYAKSSAGVNINQSSYSYQPSQNLLQFKGQVAGTNITVNEQPAPPDAQENSIVYYQSLGLHPVAQINSKNGMAVVVNFYNAKDYGSEGQNAVLIKSGVLLIAHPNRQISNEDWKNFFDNLKISR